ncbi:putative oligopeptide transport system permease protein OppC [Candidatus Hepatincolaceae symbiont of Richtersius coronifer]
MKRKIEKVDLVNNLPQGKPSNTWKDASIRFRKNKLALFSLFVLILVILLAIVVPEISRYAYDYVDFEVSFPSSPEFARGHYFGTDSNGRDLLTRIFIGVRISILVGLLSSCVSIVIGIIWGSVAGFLGGKIDILMMRIVDILYALPLMFFIIILVVVLGRNISLIFIAIGAVGWLTMARIVRGQTMSIKNREFIEASRSYALPTWLILVRHIVPNLLGSVIVYMTLTIPSVILMESFISYLGLGVQEPLTSLGVLIAEGSKVIEDYPWMFIFPCSLLAIILFCFNFIGDGLRDALDQKSK